MGVGWPKSEGAGRAEEGEQELEQVEGKGSAETGAGFFMVPKLEKEGWAAWVSKLYPPMFHPPAMQTPG